MFKTRIKDGGIYKNIKTGSVVRVISVTPVWTGFCNRLMVQYRFLECVPGNMIGKIGSVYLSDFDGFWKEVKK